MSKNKNYPKNHIFLILIILLGTIVRFFTYTQVFEQGRIVFLETDPYYHMWRVSSYINTFPSTFIFDPYINYPYGYLGWPPLFDQMIALISIIAGFGRPSVHLLELVGASVPVVLGIFSIVAVYYIAKEIFNERIALYSSLLLAVMPAHFQISSLGFTDHHIAEVLLSVLAYLFFIKSLKNSSHRLAIISGIIIGISFLTWSGAPIFIGLLLSYAVIQFIVDRRSDNDSKYLLMTGTISFLTALLVISVFYIWTPWLRTISAIALSYFQLIYVAVSAISILLLGLIARIMRHQKWYFYPLVITALIISFLLFLSLVSPSFYVNLSESVGYLLTDTPVLKQIIEAQPLFYTFDGKFLGWELFSNPVWYSFTFSFYAAIIGLIWLIYSYRKGVNKGGLFFIIWTLIILVLALMQRRFTYTLAVNVAILSGFLIDKIKSFSIKPYYIVLILILFIPNIAVAYSISQSPPKPSDDWYDSLTWLKENTPDTGQYGIMTWWDYGNWILYISKRPVVANNFQIGGDEAARFFLAANETQANAIMDARKARYVVVDRRIGLNKYIQDNQLVLKGTFIAVASFAGNDISMYLDKYNLPNENYFQTMYARMHVFDGNGLKNYRIIYESNETYYNLFDKPTKNIKIFEYVKGAKITGVTSPGTVVSLSGIIITNQEREFGYIQKTTADNKGYFEFMVPYAGNSLYKTRLLKGYELRYNNLSRSVNISENDVLNGSTIVVS